MSARHMSGGGSRQSSRGYAAQGAPRAASRHTQPRYDQAARLAEVERVKHSHGGPRPGRRKRRHRLRWVLLALFLVLLAAGGVCGYAGYSMYKDVKAVEADAKEVMAVSDALTAAVKSGDSSQIEPAVQRAASAAADMRQITHGRLWNLATHVPTYGEDVKTVQTLTDTVDNLAKNGLVPLGQSLSGVSLASLIGQDNTINVAVLQNLVAALQQTGPVIHDTNAKLQALPAAHVDKLNEMVSKARTQFASVDQGVTVAEGIAPYIPQMLGADGQTQTYLVTAQNTSEIRSTGGFPGSMGVITVTDGKMEVGEFSGISKVLKGMNGIDLGLTDEQKAAYRWNIPAVPINIIDHAGDASITPDFPLAAKIWAKEYEYVHGTKLSGVIGVNPVFLQNMMALTGQSFQVQGKTLDGSNVGTVLMHDVYFEFGNDNSAQDEFFSTAASHAFSGLFDGLGKVGVTKLSTFLTDNISAGNLRVWFADDGVANAMSGLNASGALPTDETKPQSGVYYNDLTASKMGWYVSINNQVGQATKNADGTTSYQVTTLLKNNMSGEELAEAPMYVYGANNLKRDKSDMVFQLYLTAPAGGSISGVQASSDQGESLDFGSFQVDGHDMMGALGRMRSGETITITYTVTVSAAATQPLVVYNNPTAQAIAGWA